MSTYVISKERAEAILDPYLEAIGGPLWRAWDMWKLTPLPIELAARSRANIVYDYAAEDARQTLPAIAGLEVNDARGFVIVCVEDKMVLRFKKYRDNFKTSGIRTQQRLAFENQQLTIPGMPAVTQLVAGYLLDEWQRDIAQVAITCSSHGRLIWTIDVPRSDTGTVATLKPKPFDSPRETKVRSTLTQQPDEREQSS